MHTQKMLSFNPQPQLQDNLVCLRPLQVDDFEALYAVASDPLIWEQHPNKDRYKREVFEKFFEGALASGGAFLVLDAQTQQIIGSTRYYDWNEEKSVVLIGYSFLSRAYWGGLYNPAIKALLLKHAFQYFDRVHFHVGSGNRRSQIAMERLGAKKIGELQVAYFGEPERLNFVYEITQ